MISLGILAKPCIMPIYMDVHIVPGVKARGMWQRPIARTYCTRMNMVANA